MAEFKCCLVSGGCFVLFFVYAYVLTFLLIHLPCCSFSQKQPFSKTQGVRPSLIYKEVLMPPYGDFDIATTAVRVKKIKN